MLNLALFIFGSIVLGNDDIVLGGPKKIEYDFASKLFHNTVKHLSSKCKPEENDFLCNTLYNMKLNEISKATEQIVNGKIYELEMLTNSGNLHMNIWQKTAPVRYVLQNFKIDDTEFLTEALDMTGPYF